MSGADCACADGGVTTDIHAAHVRENATSFVAEIRIRVSAFLIVASSAR
jgi:hypothetical protein